MNARVAYATSLVNIAASFAGNVLFFTLVARALGPEGFGVVALVYAHTSLLAVFLDYGYSQRILLSHGDYMRERGGIPASVLQVKILLILAICPVYVLIVAGSAHVWITIFFLVGACALSMANLFGYALRSEGRMSMDTRNQFVVALLLIVLTIIISLSGQATGEVFAFVFCISQLLYLILSIASYRKIARIHFGRVVFRDLVAEIRSNTVFAMDIFAVRAYTLLDVAVLGAFASPAQVGLYQAGQKLTVAAQIPMQAINNVLLPRLRRSEGYKDGKIRMQVLAAMAGIGLMAALPFIIAPQRIVTIVYGDAFQDLAGFMILFGVVIVLRYIAFSQSLILTASGNQKLRFKANALSLLCFFILALALTPYYGAWGVLMALAIASLVLCLAYATARRYLRFEAR